MKLLIDQNISHRLKTSLNNFFTDIKHIKELSLERASDEIINMIIENHRTIIKFTGDKENSILIIS